MNIRSRVSVVALALLTSVPALAQNVRVAQDTSTPGHVCQDASFDPLGPDAELTTVIAFAAPLSLGAGMEYCAEDPTLLPILRIDGMSLGSPAAICDDEPYETGGYGCRISLSAEALTLLNVKSTHQIGLALRDTSVAPQVTSPLAAMAATGVTGCKYVHPVTGVEETRPFGSVLQGTNPVPGHAYRVGQLRAWGWRVEWQWDPRGWDLLPQRDRVLLAAWCPSPTGDYVEPPIPGV